MPRENTFPNEILFDTWEQFYSFDLITEIPNSYNVQGSLHEFCVILLQISSLYLSPVGFIREIYIRLNVYSPNRMPKSAIVDTSNETFDRLQESQT